ncbi:hypothetical protein GGX14DRAFT_367815, partial [Mycena pura]
RFRQMPTFGRATIRRFHRNVSEMKQFAARDYEDILQCILPVLDGLFPEMEKILLDVCFDLAAFHAMAKLRLHTTATVAAFRVVTTNMCTTVRKFARDSQNIKTFETPREQERRKEAAKKLAEKNAPAGASSTAAKEQSSSVGAGAAKERKLNVETPKYHAAAGYPDAVERDGSLDSFSTQIVSHGLILFYVILLDALLSDNNLNL